MYEYFEMSDNVKLQQKLFVDIMLYFGRRGQDQIHELKVTNFAATTGKVYLYIISKFVRRDIHKCMPIYTTS
jgi:hypothetical protein